MKRLVFALCGVCLATSLSARTITFELEAFNQLYSLDYATNVVCSPASFELNCAVVAEALDTIPRAHVAETIGVLTDLESSFKTVRESLSERTNGFSFVSARTFLVPNLRYAQPTFRALVLRSYNCAVCTTFPPDGAIAWLETGTEGQLPDFELPPPNSRTDSRFSLCDLVSVRVAWPERFPTDNTKKRVFTTASGGKVALPFMQDVRYADVWKTKFFTLLRLQMTEECYFYAILPSPDGVLQDARGELNPASIDRLLAAAQARTERGSTHGMTDVTLPKMELDQTVDFINVMRFYHFPMKGLKRVAGELPARKILQRTRFVLAEQGYDEEPLPSRIATEDEKPRVPIAKVVLDRPFVFFIHHTRTQTVPVAGVFAGQ